MTERMLDGIRVVEYADEQAEYVGMVLAGLGADVIKVEPPGGSPSRQIGPFYEDQPDGERSLFFWQYNRGKSSVVLDLDQAAELDRFVELVERADILLITTPETRLAALGLGVDELRRRYPSLIIARMTPFGDEGPWRDYRASDLVHLALGGESLNCGYDPLPSGEYDTPPITPQLWHAYHIAGENMMIGIMGALYHRGRTGQGQYVNCPIHEAVAKNTEVDLMNWVMRRAPIYRQTCRHANEVVSPGPSIQQTKDGRWYIVHPGDAGGLKAVTAFLERYGMADDLRASIPVEELKGGRVIPGTTRKDDLTHATEVFGRLVRKHTFDDFPWKEAQEAGVMISPLRRPEENMDDEHWRQRGTYREVEHPEHGRSFTYVTGKWVSSRTEWVVGRRAPLLDEDRDRVLGVVTRERPRELPQRTPEAPVLSPWQKPFPLAGIRIFDFSWFLASAGGTRFLAGLGAECIKVEWAAHPDTRFGAMAPVGGREARERATAPLPPIEDDPGMGGQFNNKNPGKLGISLNVRHPEGMKIARRLIGMSDIVAEGFSPGVMNRWGLGYEALCELKPDIIYAQQSGMGANGTYGRLRAVGPIAAALSGLSEMSGLPEPAMPAGWGYSYLDWIGAYSFAMAMLAALNYRERTGKGQWIDASQTETGLFLGGTAPLELSANGRRWHRIGNRSPYRPAAPHGIYPCQGADRWIAIACFDDRDWEQVVAESGRAEWGTDPRFGTLQARLARQDALDALVSDWTRQEDRYDLMHRLQRRGVAAGACQTIEDRIDIDPQLSLHSWLTEVTGTKIGTWPVAELPVHLSETPSHMGGLPNRGAPLYGEDNEYVYGELLGMSTQQIARLKEDGAI